MMDDKVTISSNAANMGGSQMFLEANSQIKVSELIKGISIASANDAAVALSEYFRWQC
jgi:D-alanyl-D-alanine carboxypeptidase (penicillin-binding protein 5/6)